MAREELQQSATPQAAPGPADEAARRPAGATWGRYEAVVEPSRRVYWNGDGRFVRGNGESFIPLGGVYGNFLCADWAGIDTAGHRVSPMSPFGGSDTILEFTDATEAELKRWLDWLAGEGMNFIRLFCRGDMRPIQDPLDVGGKVNDDLLYRIRKYFDLCAERDMFVHFVALPEPRQTLYMDRGVCVQRALPHYTREELTQLPIHRRKYLDADRPRATYDTFFSDPDIRQCLHDYIDDLGQRLAGHPALLALEVYNEQQWGDEFFWHVYDDEVRWTRSMCQRLREAFPGVPVATSLAGFGLPGHDPYAWARDTGGDFASSHLYQLISGTADGVDFPAVYDVMTKYTQAALPTMAGEYDPGQFHQRDPEIRPLVVRDITWFSLLNGCPGMGMWMTPAYKELEIPARVFGELGFSTLDLARPPVGLDIRPMLNASLQAEREPADTCRHDQDTWCPHRDRDERHIYCVKRTSDWLQQAYQWSHYCLTHGIDYAFTDQPDQYDQAATLDDAGRREPDSWPRTFLPPAGWQLKSMRTTDGRVHLAYLRRYNCHHSGHAVGRTQGEPLAMTVGLRLGEGEYDVDIWDLNARKRSQTTCRGNQPLDLGMTCADIALVCRRR